MLYSANCRKQSAGSGCDSPSGDVEKVERLDKEERVKNAVVIGGGVLGLEAAWELKKADFM